MSRYLLIRLLLVAAIALMASGVWTAGRLQQNADNTSTQAIDAAQSMLIAMLDQETGLRGYITSRERSFLAPYAAGRERLERLFDRALADAHDGADIGLIKKQASFSARWLPLAEREIERVGDGQAPNTAGARARKMLMDGFRAANAEFINHLQRDRDRAQATASRNAVLVIIALGLVFVLSVYWAVERPIRGDARRRARLAEFSDALQIARSENEAFDVLRRHIERWLRSARAAVLMRNASANRLQAMTGLEHVPILERQLEGAVPEACLAVRLAKPHQRSPESSGLVECELCGALPEHSACVPSVVGGEVVGSVLVQMPKEVSPHEMEDLQASVAGAGPVIANLRNLAVAELRAATDVLTGLPNHRSIQDTLTRMVAQAGRSKSQLTAVLFDLDHFKQVNDIHGHAQGDAVLAAVGSLVTDTLRESDFAGRYGGEEFVLLLPETDREGGVVVAEKLRLAIEGLKVEGFPDTVSASFGIAVLPGDAVTGEQLMRSADRALYAAKNAGRNRVETLA